MLVKPLFTCGETEAGSELLSNLFKATQLCADAGIKMQVYLTVEPTEGLRKEDRRLLSISPRTTAVILTRTKAPWEMQTMYQALG